MADALYRKNLYHLGLPYSCVTKFRSTQRCLYCFGTGGTANKFPISQIKNADILVASRGFIKFYKHFELLPKYWFLHNIDSLLMTLEEDESLIRKLQFHNCYVILPSVRSYSTKRFRIFAKGFELIRKNFKGIKFLTYNDNMRYLPYEMIQTDFLKDTTNVRYPDGSIVDTAFIPLAHAMNYDEVVFSGVDHTETGHFWDLNEPYRSRSGKTLSFSERQNHSDVQSYALECNRVAEHKGIKVRQYGDSRSILFGLYQTDA